MLDGLNFFCKFVESYFYQTSFGEHSPNLLLFGFLIGSAHSCKPLSIHTTRDSNPRSVRHRSVSSTLHSARLYLRYVYARYWFSSAQKDWSRWRGSIPAPAIERSRSSHSSRSLSVTSSTLRHTCGWGQPEILCSGITRPSSRMKSRQTKPQRTSLRIVVSDPVEDLNEMIWPSSGGQFASVRSCFAVDFIVSRTVG